MRRTFYIADYQEQIMFDFVALVEKQQEKDKKKGLKPKSYSSLIVEFMENYIKEHKVK